MNKKRQDTWHHKCLFENQATSAKVLGGVKEIASARPPGLRAAANVGEEVERRAHPPGSLAPSIHLQTTQPGRENQIQAATGRQRHHSLAAEARSPCSKLA